VRIIESLFTMSASVALTLRWVLTTVQPRKASLVQYGIIRSAFLSWKLLTNVAGTAMVMTWFARWFL
jgi:hypothetical protein